MEENVNKGDIGGEKQNELRQKVTLGPTRGMGTRERNNSRVRSKEQKGWGGGWRKTR